MGVYKEGKNWKVQVYYKDWQGNRKRNRKEDSGPRVKLRNGKGYSPTYLKTVNCQLTAIFNYAMRYYNLQDNPCRKAGAIGKSKGEPKDFWMQEEFNAFLETVSDKPETRMAFLLLYWTGMRIGELLAIYIRYDFGHVKSRRQKTSFSSCI